METLRHYVGGKFVEGTADRFAEVDNPATGELSASVPLATAADVDAAVSAASEAFPEWSATSSLRRARIMFKFKALLDDNMDALVSFPDQLDELSYDGPTLFLAGADSLYLQLAHLPRIRSLFPASEIDAIAAAGHWVHADQPEAFLARVRAFLA